MQGGIVKPADVPVIAYSCFVDGTPRYQKQALRFIYSLLDAGKSLDSVFIALSDAVPAGYEQLLRDSVGVKSISRHTNFSKTSKPANKWLQLEKQSFDGFSHVIINDCDKVYVSFDERWATNAVRACKFVPRPTFRIFEALFDRYQLGAARFQLDKPDPRDEYRDPRNYVNNHNGGLIIIPTDRIAAVTSCWKYYIDRLHEDIEILGDYARNLDQVAFAMAMQALNEDINFLPKSLDIGIGVSTLSPHLHNSGQLILHIHADEDDAGQIVSRERTCDDLRTLISDFNLRYIDWLKTNGAYEFCFNEHQAA